MFRRHTFFTFMLLLLCILNIHPAYGQVPARRRPPARRSSRRSTQPETPRLNLPEEVYVAWEAMDEQPGIRVTMDMAAHKTATGAGYIEARLRSDLDLEDVEIISPDGNIFLVHPKIRQISLRSPGFFLGRFSGEPERITIQCKVRGEPFSLTFSGSMPTVDVISLPKEWAKARAEVLWRMMSKYGRNDFCANEILRLAGKYGLNSRRWRSQRFWRRDELAELDGLFAIATGAAAIDETLQLETLRQVQESAVAEQTVPISSRQEFAEGEAEDMAQVLSLNESVTVAFGAFENCLQTMEWTPLEPETVEHKFYAPGVGLLMEVQVEDGSDRVELVEIQN